MVHAVGETILMGSPSPGDLPAYSLAMWPETRSDGHNGAVIRQELPGWPPKRRTMEMGGKIVSCQVRRCCHYPYCEELFNQVNDAQLTCAACTRLPSQHDNLCKRVLNRIDSASTQRCSGCKMSVATRAYGLYLDGSGDTWNEWGQRHYKVGTRCIHPGCKCAFEKEHDGHSMCVPCGLASSTYVDFRVWGQFIGCCDACEPYTAGDRTPYGVPLSLVPTFPPW